MPINYFRALPVTWTLSPRRFTTPAIWRPTAVAKTGTAATWERPTAAMAEAVVVRGGDSGDRKGSGDGSGSSGERGWR